MAPAKQTPGVYINELNAFPNSIIAVPTAVPVFVGYTQGNTYQGKNYQNTAVPISSLTDYIAFFCNGQQPTTCNTQFTVAKASNPTDADVTIAGIGYNLTPQAGTMFYLYNSLLLFFQNGGATCYVVSVGTYDKEGAQGPSIKHFYDADNNVNIFNTLSNVNEPTLVLIPDALLFSTAADYYTLMNASLNHCGEMQSRMALIDVYGGSTITNLQTFINLSQQTDANGNSLDPVGQLRGGINSQYVNYGAAYYPFVNTAIVQQNQITSSNIAGGFTPDPADPNGMPNLLNAILTKVNCLPVTPAVAGCITQIDITKGVWQAPAGIACNLINVDAPVLNITDSVQANMNADAVTGKSVNAIRTLPNYGVVIWGARTLDGNSQDWRYINVRRTLIMIEQSIKYALQSYIFQPNVSNTWVAVQSSISNFLTSLWAQGALQGAKPSDAFNVQVGLGVTMTAQDILNGLMNVSVQVAVTHPAEFIVLTFQQEMQTS